MDFRLTTEDEAFAKAVRDFAEEEMTPLIDEAEAKETLRLLEEMVAQSE